MEDGALLGGRGRYSRQREKERAVTEVVEDKEGEQQWGGEEGRGGGRREGGDGRGGG